MKDVRARVVESAKSLATWCRDKQETLSIVKSEDLYLSNSTNVLLTVLGREAQVFVQAKADIVAVETVSLQTEVEQMLFQGRGNGGLARGRKTSEPDGSTLLLAEVGALLAGEARVPGDVARPLLELLACFRANLSYSLTWPRSHSRCHIVFISWDGSEAQIKLNESNLWFVKTSYSTERMGGVLQKSCRKNTARTPISELLELKISFGVPCIRARKEPLVHLSI